MGSLTTENNPALLRDAVTLLKSDFVGLYVKMGYDRQEVGELWHTLRVSSAGYKLKKDIGAPSTAQATSFISDIDEEAKTRLGKKAKKKEAWQDDPNCDGSDAFNRANEAELKSGTKEEVARKLIDSGLTKAAALAKEGNFSIPYAYLMLKKYKKKEIA